jgi:hypothetical protein
MFPGGLALSFFFFFFSRLAEDRPLFISARAGQNMIK